VSPGTLIALVVFYTVIKGPPWIFTYFIARFVVRPLRRKMVRNLRGVSRSFPVPVKHFLIRHGFNPHKPENQ
jgi:hypothetical protein